MDDSSPRTESHVPPSSTFLQEIARLHEQIAFYDAVDRDAVEVLSRLGDLARRTAEMRERSGRDLVSAMRASAERLAETSFKHRDDLLDVAGNLVQVRAGAATMAAALAELDARLTVMARRTAETAVAEEAAPPARPYLHVVDPPLIRPGEDVAAGT